MKCLSIVWFSLFTLIASAQESNLTFELNGRASNDQIMNGKRITQNPFKQFIGEWTLKENQWTHNWGNETETIHIFDHHTISSQINTEHSLLSIIDGPEPNGHIYWFVHPTTKEVFHSSSFGTRRTGYGKGTINENGDLKLNISFADEAPGTYRIYTYTWINQDEYELHSIQYDSTGKKTGLFYTGNFIRLPKSLHLTQNDAQNYKEKLVLIHEQFVKARKEENPNLIMPYYTDSTLFTPEFHPLILGKKNIREYYRTINDRQNVQSYNRKSQDVICFGDRIVEWGTFAMKFIQNNEGPYSLKGKFMNVWEVLEDETLILKSEQWNYDHTIDENIHLTTNLEGLPLRYQTENVKNITNGLKHELDAYYLLDAKAVIERDPIGRLNSFDPEGIFLAPHGETAKIGLDAIKEYLISYNAGEVNIDSLDVGMNHVEDYGAFVIKNNYYYVKASGEGWTYEGQGLGTELLQRNTNGQLRRILQISSEYPVTIKPIPPVVDAFQTATLEGLLNQEALQRSLYYTDESYLMGEYQKVVKGKSNIEHYYQAFLERFQVHDYEKKRVELLDLGNWMIETGNFKMDLTAKNNSSSKTYHGKYQNLWHLDQNGDWKIFAEAWNYNHQITDWAIFCFPEIKAFDHQCIHLEETPIQVLAHNELSESIISAHDSKKWAQLFDEQGMLLYSHSPLYQGKPAIANHLAEHVKTLPTFNTLNIGNFFVEELDEYIIELGNHYVDWSKDTQNGISTGKNIRIWKKHPDGSIKIFRQTAMYDYNDPE